MGCNRCHGDKLTLSSDVDQDTKMFGLHERPLTYPCIISDHFVTIPKIIPSQGKRGKYCGHMCMSVHTHGIVQGYAIYTAMFIDVMVKLGLE